MDRSTRKHSTQWSCKVFPRGSCYPLIWAVCHSNFELLTMEMSEPWKAGPASSLDREDAGSPERLSDLPKITQPAPICTCLALPSTLPSLNTFLIFGYGAGNLPKQSLQNSTYVNEGLLEQDRANTSVPAHGSTQFLIFILPKKKRSQITQTGRV